MENTAMSPEHTQISAHISVNTKTLVEHYTEAHGVKKGHLVEEALLHHLHALRELPPDVIIPPKLIASKKSMALIMDRVRNPKKPAHAIQELFAKKTRPKEAPKNAPKKTH
jgi:hypothetical protein